MTVIQQLVTNILHLRIIPYIVVLIFPYVLLSAPMQPTRPGFRSAVSRPATDLPTFGVTYSGFVKVDTHFDTRQVDIEADGLDEGTFVTVPQPKKLDPLGRDINNQGHYHKLLYQTRLRYDISSRNINQDTTIDAFVEGDFYGVPPFVGNYRLRHAFMILKHKKFSALFGHFWHPMIAVECAPDQLAADGGTPLALECRAPFIQFKYNIYKKLDVMLTFASQFGYTSNGPDGFTNIYARNSMTPNINFRAHVLSDQNIIGCSFDFKRLRPRLVSDKGFKVNEIISSVAATFFFAHKWDENFLTKWVITAGQNLNNMYMLSGFGVHSINPVTDERTYANISGVSSWGELIYTTELWEPAIFVGACKNIGASKRIIPEVTNPDGTTVSTIYSLFPNIDTIVRIAPRIRLFLGPIVLAGEAGWTRAGFGKILPDAKVDPCQPTWLLRLFATVYYFF